MTSSIEPTGGPVVVTPATLRGWPLPQPGESKDARGRLLIVGGTEETPGSVRLAAEAALRAGAGKVRVATAAASAPVLGTAMPETAVLGLPVDAHGNLAASAADRLLEEAASTDVVLVGTGCTDVDATVALLNKLIPGLDVPVVVDALGSAYLTERPDGLHHLHGRAVATLNPTEVARTAGCSEDDLDRDPDGVTRALAQRCRITVVCGGTAKHVADADRSWVVEGGGPGLAISGSGDVLAGIVAGLVSGGAEAAQAAVWGSHVHARLGERLAAAVGPVGYLAREMPEQVPGLLAELH